MPQVEPPRQPRAFTVFIAFCITASRCSFQRSFVSMTSPRYLHVVWGVTLPHAVCMGLLLSIRVSDLV
ncbi:hypothetical protein BKA63DRAFT_528351, partial [Paraphoma chrysanthemicola]